MKYKVGDVIKIRNDLEVGKSYGGLIMHHGDMDKMLIGQEVSIIEEYDDNDYYTSVGYFITEEMIERRIDMNRIKIENRIAKLKTNPVENAKIIKKWERKLRKCE